MENNGFSESEAVCQQKYETTLFLSRRLHLFETAALASCCYFELITPVEYLLIKRDIFLLEITYRALTHEYRLNKRKTIQFGKTDTCRVCALTRDYN